MVEVAGKIRVLEGCRPDDFPLGELLASGQPAVLKGLADSARLTMLRLARMPCLAHVERRPKHGMADREERQPEPRLGSGGRHDPAANLTGRTRPKTIQRRAPRDQRPFVAVIEAECAHLLPELDDALNFREVQSFSADALHGGGVFETLKGISELVLRRLAAAEPTA